MTRSIEKLPALGERNPTAALLIERTIDDWMPAPNGDAQHERETAADQPPTAAARERFTRERKASAARMRAIGAWRTADWLDAHPYPPAVHS